MKIGILIILLFIQMSAKASIDVGVGFNSATSGRKVPALAISYAGTDMSLSAHSTGVQSDLYYQSSYGVNYFYTWNSGEFLGGTIKSGFGLGLFYSQNEFLDSGTTTAQSDSDFGMGPGFKVQWEIFGPFYIDIESIFGLRDLSRHITLNSQDFVYFSFGVKIL